MLVNNSVCIEVALIMHLLVFRCSQNLITLWLCSEFKHCFVNFWFPNKPNGIITISKRYHISDILYQIWYHSRVTNDTFFWTKVHLSYNIVFLGNYDIYSECYLILKIIFIMSLKIFKEKVYYIYLIDQVTS